MGKGLGRLGGQTFMPIECLTTFFIINGHASLKIRNGTMAVKKNVKQNGDGKVEWQGSYNYYLTTADKAGIKKMGVGPQEILGRWAELLAHGYKVSASIDGEERFYTVTAYNADKSCPNAGYSLSQRHSDLFTAINAVWFVIAEVYGWEVWEDIGQPELAFNW